MRPRTAIWNLGCVEYEDGIALQDAIISGLRAGSRGNTVLLLEHPPVITLGRAARAENVTGSAAALASFGVSLHRTDRGGDVTYHGPGQIVGYPLLFLPPGQQDVRRYVHSLEEVLIRTLAGFGIAATRVEGRPGVWIAKSRLGGTRKIAAIGVHLSRWFTRHGFALNVAPNLTHYDLIVPCGITDAGVTSMAVERKAEIDPNAVRREIGKHLGEVFTSGISLEFPLRSAVAVIVTAGEGVLALRSPSDRGGSWRPVTGWLDAQKLPAEAAVRALEAETGLSLPLKALGLPRDFLAPTAGETICRQFAFVARLPQRMGIRLSEKHCEFAWIPMEQAIAQFELPALQAALREAFS